MNREARARKTSREGTAFTSSNDSAALDRIEQGVPHAGGHSLSRMAVLAPNRPPAVMPASQIIAHSTPAIHRTVDTLVAEIWAARKGSPILPGDWAVKKLTAHGLTKDDKPKVREAYDKKVAEQRDEARKNATGITTWAEMTSVLSGNSGGQSYYKMGGSDYPHVSVEWESAPGNRDEKGPKRIKKLHVTVAKDGPRYWWGSFEKGVGSYQETSGDRTKFPAGSRAKANAAVEALVMPLHINPGRIPDTEPGA